MKLVPCELNEATHLQSATGHVWGPCDWRSLESSEVLELEGDDGYSIQITQPNFLRLGITPMKAKTPMRMEFEGWVSRRMGDEIISLPNKWLGVPRVRVTIEEILGDEG